MRSLTYFAATAGMTVLLVGSLTTVATAQPGQAAGHAAPVGQKLYAFNTGLVLTVAQQASPGAVVRVEKDAGRSGQSWTLTRHANLSPASDPRLCLTEWTARRGSLRLDVRSCDGSVAQKFVTSAPSAHTPVFFISPRSDQSLCVGAQTDVSFFGTTVQTPIVGLSKCANAQGQAWSTANLANVVGQFARNWIRDLVVPGTGQPGGLAYLQFVTRSLSEEWTLTAGPTGMIFSPIENTSSCLTTRGPGRQLMLSSCDGTPAQNILPILLRPTTDILTYVLGVADAQRCLVRGKSRPGKPAPVVVGACPNTTFPRAAGIWYTESPADYNLHLPSVSADFEGFYDEPQQFSNEFGMTVRGTASGSGVALTQDNAGFLQTWTDIRPGKTTTANPDGSISIRPLNELAVCLTVPGANYQAGVRLQVQTCDGTQDQEFSAVIPVVNGLSGPAVFSPFADSSLCLAPLAGVKGGSQVGLETCPAQQSLSQDDTWEGFSRWTSWVNPTT